MSLDLSGALFAYKSELIAALSVFAAGMFSYAAYSYVSSKTESRQGKSSPTDDANDSCPTISELPQKADNTIGDASWPPPQREVQVYSVREMFRANAGLIHRICSSSQLSDEEASAYLLPAISNLAHLVHLVPASEYDHHQGYGGLFTHSLEVALYAANLERSVVHERAKCPTDDHNNKRRWILCAILAGLAHDIGKVYADMMIVTCDKASWTHEVPLLDWLRKTHTASYFVNFLPNREHNRHRKISHARLHQLIPGKTLAFLSLTGYGAVMFDAIADAIQDSTGPLGKNLEAADRRSTKEDLARQQTISPNLKNLSHPQGDLLLKVFRALISSKKWTANEGRLSTVFNSRQGCFIVWTEQTANEILSKASELDYKAIPSGEAHLQQILIRAGVLLKSPEGESYIWTVTPHVAMDDAFSCICLSGANLIFDAPPPPAIESLVEGVAPDATVFKAWRESGRPLKDDPMIAQSSQKSAGQTAPENCTNSSSDSKSATENVAQFCSSCDCIAPISKKITLNHTEGLIPAKGSGVNFLKNSQHKTKQVGVPSAQGSEEFAQSKQNTLGENENTPVSVSATGNPVRQEPRRNPSKADILKNKPFLPEDSRQTPSATASETFIAAEPPVLLSGMPALADLPGNKQDGDEEAEFDDTQLARAVSEGEYEAESGDDSGCIDADTDVAAPSAPEISPIEIGDEDIPEDAFEDSDSDSDSDLEIQTAPASASAVSPSEEETRSQSLTEKVKVTKEERTTIEVPVLSIPAATSPSDMEAQTPPSLVNSVSASDSESQALTLIQSQLPTQKSEKKLRKTKKTASNSAPTATPLLTGADADRAASSPGDFPASHSETEDAARPASHSDAATIPTPTRKKKVKVKVGDTRNAASVEKLSPTEGEHAPGITAVPASLSHSNPESSFGDFSSPSEAEVQPSVSHGDSVCESENNAAQPSSKPSSFPLQPSPAPASPCEIQNEIQAIEEMCRQMLEGKGKWITERMNFDPITGLQFTSSLTFETALRSNGIDLDLVLWQISRRSHNKVVPRIELEQTQHRIYLYEQR